MIRDNVKMATLPKMIYTFNAIPFKISAVFLCRNSQANPKIHMEMQGIQNSPKNLEKEQTWKTHFLISNLTTKLAT